MQNAVTSLILSRKPTKLFQLETSKGMKRGRFGVLVAFSGPPIESVSIVPDGSPTGSAMELPGGLFINIKCSQPGRLVEQKRFTTIERMDGYIQLHPQLGKPYTLTFEQGNKNVSQLARTQGNCFRVHGGHRKEAGILIHAAPHVGWLIGCIGPRKHGDLSIQSTETTYDAMDELFELSPKPSQLCVLNW